MGDERIKSVPANYIQEFEKKGKRIKWVKPALEIKKRLDGGEKVVGYYIGFDEIEERPYEVINVQNALAQRLRAAYYQQSTIYSSTRFCHGENEMQKGWWLLLSLHPIE